VFFSGVVVLFEFDLLTEEDTSVCAGYCLLFLLMWIWRLMKRRRTEFLVGIHFSSSLPLYQFQ